MQKYDLETYKKNKLQEYLQLQEKIKEFKNIEESKKRIAELKELMSNIEAKTIEEKQCLENKQTFFRFLVF